MKKKLVSALLCATMAASLLAGCGSGDTSDTGSSGKKGDAKTEVTNDGKILNIYCWNDEFQSRITDHYPDYKKVDATHGKIGDIDVVWNITPSENNAYQNNLDETLLKQADASADDKIDLFLVEADYAPKYVDSDYTMPIKDLGITDSDISKQYKYTQDVVTDSEGNLKGLSWQGCPGVLFYNRAAAKEVLGTDDPDEVQKSVSDWDAFNATAEKMKAAGYKMTSTANDTYRVYSNNVSKKWVSDDKKIQIDDNIMKWVDDSKKLVDAGETGTADLWSDDWKKGFFWGGTWICAAAGTDNADLVKDIMLKMTTDDDIMKDIVVKDDDFVNNSTVMDGMADGTIMGKDDKPYTSTILGGQNPLPMYIAGVKTLDLSNLSAYDQGCNEEFQKAMKDYFEGNCDKDTAIETFKKAVIEKYPDLAE